MSRELLNEVLDVGKQTLENGGLFYGSFHSVPGKHNILYILIFSLFYNLFLFIYRFSFFSFILFIALSNSYFLFNLLNDEMKGTGSPLQCGVPWGWASHTLVPGLPLL